jgi:hypothetical protein
MSAFPHWGKNPSPTPPHKGEGLNLPFRCASTVARRVPRVLSPLVGEMADRPEGVLVARHPRFLRSSLPARRPAL